MHGGINLLTQGSARTLWCVMRSLACQLTNPLTRPEHDLLTPCSQTLLTPQLTGLSRGRWSGQGSGRPWPRPGVSVQTPAPGRGLPTIYPSSATCSFLSESHFAGQWEVPCPPWSSVRPVSIEGLIDTGQNPLKQKKKVKLKKKCNGVRVGAGGPDILEGFPA